MSHNEQTAAALLREARQVLASSGSETPALDAELLLRHILAISREELYMRLLEPVSADSAATFRMQVQRRSTGIPVAYITGAREFYGREFHVDKSVLIPRPETEHLVETAIQWLHKHGSRRRTVIDVGTGSGAISVSIAAETRGQHLVIGSDVSSEALNVARGNRHCHGVSVELVNGSLLDWCRGTIDVIVANLPYLRPDQAHEGIRFEPEIALFAGDDGFALNRKLIHQAAGLLGRPGLLVMEIDPSQRNLALDCARRAFPDGEVSMEIDLAGLERMLVVQLADFSSG